MIQPRRPLAPGVVAGHYQELDRLYREVWGEHVHHGLWRTGRETPLEAVEQLAAFVAEQAGVRPGDRVVDIGSGYGASARYTAEHFGAKVTALTTDPGGRAFLLSAASRNRIFLLTMARIWAAYRTGAMRYLVSRARRPG